MIELSSLIHIFLETLRVKFIYFGSVRSLLNGAELKSMVRNVTLKK